MLNATMESAYQSFCRTRFDLPTTTDISNFETKLGLSLPNDYRQFLCEFNGGVFSDPDIVVADPDCPEDCLTLLYGLSVVPPSADLARPANIAVFGPVGTREVLPIGYTLMGNLLYVLVAGSERGIIGLKQKSSDNYFHLAEGIEAFFAQLRPGS